MQKGYKRILLMRDLRHASTIRNRKAGYLEALQEADDRVTNGSVVLFFAVFRHKIPVWQVACVDFYNAVCYTFLEKMKRKRVI